jgi:hypothetical protein
MNAENESWLAEMIEEAAVFRRQAHRGCEVLSLPSQDHQGLIQQHFVTTSMWLRFMALGDFQRAAGDQTWIPGT